MERNLNITISIHDPDELTIEILEPESGDHVIRDFPCTLDEDPGFNQWFWNEIYFWISTILDEMEDAK